MPIKIPDKLPAFDTLVNEGVRVMTETAAIRQDIRPLQIGLLNLMPNKIKTELQLARLLGASPLQVELSLVRIVNSVVENSIVESGAALTACRLRNSLIGERAALTGVTGIISAGDDSVFTSETIES
jgi:hypothetical protein